MKVWMDVICICKMLNSLYIYTFIFPPDAQERPKGKPERGAKLQGLKVSPGGLTEVKVEVSLSGLRAGSLDVLQSTDSCDVRLCCGLNTERT